MAFKEWYETMTAVDCIKDHTTWNDMVIYIQHSACTDFTIYSECTNTGQAFRFTQNDALSEMIGGADTGDDLKIRANDSDTYPYLFLNGDANLEYYCADSSDHIFYEGTNQLLSISGIAGITYLAGQEADGEDLEILANTTNIGSKIKLNGAGNLNFYVDTDKSFMFYELDAFRILQIDYDGDDTHIVGPDNATGDLHLFANTDVNCTTFLALNNDSIYLSSATSQYIYFRYDDINVDYLRFGANVTGTEGLINGPENSGNDLTIKANQTDDYPYLRLNGNDLIQLNTKTNIKFYDESSEFMKFLLAGNTGYIYGPSSATGTLTVNANSGGGGIYPFIRLNGNSDIMNFSLKNLNNTFRFEVSNGAHNIFHISSDGDDSILEAPSSGSDIFLKTNSAYVKFGTYTASTICHTGYIEIKDAGGTVRKIMIGE